MASYFVVHRRPALRSALAGLIVLSGLGLGVFQPLALAKDSTLAAIEVYDGPAGPAYIQLTEILINSKTEMRDCTPYRAAGIDKSTYGKLEKVILSEGGVLERGADGVMQYRNGEGATLCVVPVNVKFDHNATYSLSDLADAAVLRATPIGTTGSTPTVAPPIKKGTTLYFVPVPNVELAEFLRARRASTVPDWQNFLAKFPASPHLAEAKRTLATLFIQSGETSFALYAASAGKDSPSYADLKSAKTKSDQAHALTPNLEAGLKLEREVRSSLETIVGQGRSELNLFHTALSGHTAGYVHLLNAKKFSDLVSGIDPLLQSGQNLQGDVMQDENSFEAQVQSAVFAQNAKQYDQAFSYVLPFRAFADEESRIASVIENTYTYHLSRGAQFKQDSDWKNAIAEYEKAVATKDTPEARQALSSAKDLKIVFENKAAATKALETSKTYESQHNLIRAYEVLANLPETQRKLVTAEMTALESGYITAASAEAKGLRQAHDPIRGLADEQGIENAYRLLANAYTLSQNESYRDRMNLLGNELSTYLLEQAKHYIGKPGGSGTELGWTYLTEAEGYKAENLDAVRDTMEQTKTAHSMRSKLSIRVQFRDQTSQRESAGFADQLENAIATGLQNASIPVKVIAYGDKTVVDPDFQLVGDVILHHCPADQNLESPESKYLYGQREVPSEEWNKANRAYEKVQEELHLAQAALQAAQQRKDKKEMEEASKDLATVQKESDRAQDKLDATPKTVSEPIYHTYKYTRRTITIHGAIKLQFHIEDPLNAQIGDPVVVDKKVEKPFVLLEGVNAEDTEGIKTSGTAPDIPQIMSALESDTLESLVSAVRKKVEDLPKIMYHNATTSEAAGDLDGAGELYMRYLKIAPGSETEERTRATNFLREQFNMELPSGNAQ